MLERPLQAMSRALSIPLSFPSKVRAGITYQPEDGSLGTSAAPSCWVPEPICP
jgi:hypothetical protein